MKTKVSKKEIRNYYNTILSVGYCDLQHLLHGISPDHYSAGIYGWSCDYYEFGNVVICTGYSPIGKMVDYELVKRYDDAARKIKNETPTWSEVESKLSALIGEFILEAIK